MNTYTVTLSITMTMPSTVGPSPPSNRGLTVESLPTVDLRLLTQSELSALSQSCIDLVRCDDVVIPEIDRSVFNESAGSRKQTYSRLRLAPRNTTTATPPPTIARNNDDDDEYEMNKGGCSSSLSSFDYDNSRIISLFKTLFNNNNVSLEYSDATTGERKRKPGMNNLSTTTTKDEEKGLVNRKGEVVDLRELGTVEDPYGEEIRRRTEGKESAEELLGFISDLKGQWGSRRMKRKIVDANVFGHSLPLGWKLLIAVKKKLGRATVFCHRYIRYLAVFFISFALCNAIIVGS